MLNKIFPENSKRGRLLRKIYHRIFKESNNQEDSYTRWRKENLPSKKELKLQENTKFEIMPKISVIVPLYNTPEKFFKELVECMKNQTYSNWELCLADGSSKPLDFRDKYIQNDDRIKYKIITENKGISGNTNEALSIVTGDFIGLLDHDDYLPEYSLFEVVKTINENPSVEFMYSDEDKFEEVNGNHYGAFFKPDFSLYTLNSSNYIGHFCVFSKNLMDKLGGFNSKYDGSQDFDIVSRASSLAENIVHIPNILYNWRVHKNSTASGTGDVKPYAYEVAKNVIKDHLKRKNISAEVIDGDVLGSYRVEYKPISIPLISIIIETDENTTKNDIENIIKMLNNLTYKNFEYIIISEKKYDVDFDLIYASDWNSSVGKSNGEYFYIIDRNLFEIDNKSIFENLIGICQNSDVAIVSPKLYDENNLVLHNGIILGMCGIGGYVFRGIPKFYDVYMARLKIIHNVSAVTLKYSLIKKSEYESVNGFDNYFNGMAQNIDFCLKLINNNKNIVLNPITEIGIKSLDEKNSNDIENKKIIEKWEKDIKNDRFYNKNLRTDILNIDIKNFKV